MLRRTLGPDFGLEPKRPLAPPQDVDFASKSWSLCDTRRPRLGDVGGGDGEGTFEAVSESLFQFLLPHSWSGR